MKAKYMTCILSSAKLKIKDQIRSEQNKYEWMNDAFF